MVLSIAAIRQDGLISQLLFGQVHKQVHPRFGLQLISAVKIKLSELNLGIQIRQLENS